MPICGSALVRIWDITKLQSLNEESSSIIQEKYLNGSKSLKYTDDGSLSMKNGVLFKLFTAYSCFVIIDRKRLAILKIIGHFTLY